MAERIRQRYGSGSGSSNGAANGDQIDTIGRARVRGFDEEEPSSMGSVETKHLDIKSSTSNSDSLNLDSSHDQPSPSQH